MIINRTEFSTIDNEELPVSWKSKTALENLQAFLEQSWAMRELFYDDGKISSQQQFLGFGGSLSIKMKNYVGTICFKGEQLNIYPKVFGDNNDDGNENNYKLLAQNLAKWISYGSKSSYPFISMEVEFRDADNLKDLFVLIYIRYLQKTLERGAFYQYIDEIENCNTIKGRFDICDYLVRKIPTGEGNKFRCEYSKFDFDNLFNRIIKYTCTILYKETSQANQKLLRKILAVFSDVSLVVCTPIDCDRVRLGGKHNSFKIILNMSKMFLLNKVASYEEGEHGNYCFLFPMEILFEGFIGGYIEEYARKKGGRVKLQEKSSYLFDDVLYDGKALGAAFNMKPDILVELQGKSFIMDTKYKLIRAFHDNPTSIREIIAKDVSPADVYQMCEYARKKQLKQVFLLYPMQREEIGIDTKFPVGISDDINIYFVRIPFVFEDNENVTTEMLDEILSVCWGI